MMHYLNQDAAVFRESPDSRAQAISELLQRALAVSHSFRIEFDGQRLRRVIGGDTFSRLTPNQIKEAGSVSAYDVYEDTLDSEKTEILKRILLAPQEYAERPLNYIKSIRLLDSQGKSVLRGGDHNTFILFSLPEEAFNSLIDAYRENHIPENVIEEVEVEVEKLSP